MRRITLIFTALCAVFSATAANAQSTDESDQSVEVSETEAVEAEDADDEAGGSDGITVSGEFVFASAYDDTRLFNDRFSDRPIAQLEFVFDLGNGVYVTPYVYTGFDDPGNDDGSEYGAEAGVEREVGNGVTANIAVGRYSNYGGGGFGAGDWFARVGVSYKGASVSITGLSGDSDTLVLNGAYEAKVAESFTLTPSIAYVTSTGALNFALTAEAELPQGFAIRGSVVLPETGNGREAYAAAALVLRF